MVYSMVHIRFWHVHEAQKAGAEEEIPQMPDNQGWAQQ